jgi:cytochrome c553
MDTATPHSRRTRRVGSSVCHWRPARAAAWTGLLLMMMTALPTWAQDAGRGARLFNATGGETGRPVGNCAACHANREALTEMIRNRGSKPDDARAIEGLLQRAIDGAQPGAARTKAQYRGVLTPADVRDLALYLARSGRG